MTRRAPPVSHASWGFGLAVLVLLASCDRSEALGPGAMSERDGVAVPPGGALSLRSPEAGPPSRPVEVGPLSAAVPGLYDDLVSAPERVTAAADPKAVATPGLVWQSAYTGANGVSLGTGQRSIWHMNGTTWSGQYTLVQTVPVAWRIAASADFDGDGDGDLVWQNVVTGDRSIWLMVGNQWQGAFALLPKVPVQWEIAAAADFTGDYKPDLIWQNLVTGDRSIWHMNGTSWPGGNAYTLLPRVAVQWRIAAAADFTGDERADLVWQNAYIGPAGTPLGTGQRSIWHMNGTQWSGQFTLLQTVPVAWLIAAAADFSGDNETDLVWQNVVTGQRSIWHMNGTQWPGQFSLLQTVPVLWRIATHLAGGPVITAPVAPSNLTATAISTSQIDLAWEDHADNEDGFKIERCSGSECTDFLEIASVGRNTQAYQNTGLSAPAVYHYRVRAFNSGGNSAYSNTADATLDPPHFAVDRFEVAGNIAGGFVDDFDDGSLTVPPTSAFFCGQGTPVEAGGFLMLPRPFTYCALDSPSGTHLIRDGNGDATITAAFRAKAPAPGGHAYALQFFTPRAQAQRNELVQLTVSNGGSGPIANVLVARATGGSPDVSDPIPGPPVPLDLSGVSTILLRMRFDDATNLVAASLSIDGGASFVSVPLPAGVEPRLMVLAPYAVTAVWGGGPTTPAVSIELPRDRTGYPQGVPITFRGSVVDGGALVWTSDRDGQLGTGTSFARNDLSLGTHIITLRATDGQGGTVTASVTVTIAPPGTAFDRALERLEIGGNIPGGFVDEFDDGSLTLPPTSGLYCVQPSGESGGFLRLSSLDGANNFTPGVLVDNCFLGQEAPSVRLRHGRGNAVATAVFRAESMPLGHGFGMQMVTFGASETVGISVSGQDRALVVSTGASGSPGSSQVIDLTGVDRIFLRLELDDVTDGGGRVLASFSIDGGRTFTLLAVPAGARIFTASDEAIVSVFAHAVIP